MSNFLRPHRGGQATLAPRVIALAVLLALAAARPAAAAPDDGLQFIGGLGYFDDDNLFRLPRGHAGYQGQKSDSARYATAGLLFDKTYGRQKIYLQGKASKVKFNHFEQLDYTGKDVLGLLNWQLGNRFDGSAGASYEQTLAAYTDFRSQERNLREHRRAHADGGWRPHPSWRLRAGAARDKYTYEQTRQQLNDRTEDMVEAGFDYQPASGSTAGLVLRRIEGDYAVPRFARGARLNDDFTQDELKAKIHWKLTGMSSLQVLAGYARRRHDSAAQRDASGFNGRATLSLHPRQKLRVNAAAWREFSPVESELVSYSTNSGASAGASWEATARLRIEGALSRERRRYDAAGLVPGAFSVSDTLSQASLGATWSLKPAVQLNAALAHQRRTGADFMGNGSFRANTFSLTATARF